MKSKVDELNVDKLKTVPTDLSKLSHVKNELVKKAEYDQLFKKINAIQTTDTIDLVIKDDYKTKIGEVEKKILYHDHDKYITTQEINKITKSNFAAMLKEAKLAIKGDIADFA